VLLAWHYRIYGIRPIVIRWQSVSLYLATDPAEVNRRVTGCVAETDNHHSLVSVAICVSCKHIHRNSLSQNDIANDGINLKTYYPKLYCACLVLVGVQWIFQHPSSRCYISQRLRRVMPIHTVYET